jgi:flavin-dependent dehydrogenase
MKILETGILIIGGGPAGSTTALYLSRLGFDITVIEKKPFPRETLCGEFLSKEVTAVLKDLNLFADFILLNPNRINSFRAIDYSGTELRSDLSFEAYAMKRSVFDTFLLEKVKLRNVNVIQPAEVISTEKINSDFISVIKDKIGELITIKSKLVIAAYGKQNILDKKLHRGFIDKKSNLNGIKFHMPTSLLNENFSDEIRIYTNEGLYCGMNIVSDTEITICFLENRKDSKISAREKLITVIESNRYFHKLFSANALDYIRSATIYGTGNIYFGQRNLIENDIIMIGDAAQVISPLAGDGIGMAMESGRLLYETIFKNKLDDSNREKIYSEYRNNFKKVFKNRLRTARIIQRLIMNKILCKIGFRIVSRYPVLLSYMIKLSRSLN